MTTTQRGRWGFLAVLLVLVAVAATAPAACSCDPDSEETINDTSSGGDCPTDAAMPQFEAVETETRTDGCDQQCAAHYFSAVADCGEWTSVGTACTSEGCISACVSDLSACISGAGDDYQLCAFGCDQCLGPLIACREDCATDESCRAACEATASDCAEWDILCLDSCLDSYDVCAETDSSFDNLELCGRGLESCVTNDCLPDEGE
ncbi:hypothetical protein KDL45_07585 [bacterium]|nr:hypothetical protein [bacterium]